MNWEIEYNRRGKTIIAIIFFLGFLGYMKGVYGLFYIKMTHLSKEDLEWVAPAEQYPTAYFTSNRGKNAQLIVTEKYVANETNRFYFSTGSDDKYEANAGYDYKITCDSIEIEGLFAVARLIQNENLGFNASLDYFFTLSSDSNYLLLRSGTVVIRGREFQNCIVVNNKNAEFSENWINEVKNKIDEFVISKEYGLIYYRFEDGEQFFRVFPDDE